VAWSTAAIATEPLWGSTPISTFMSAHAPPFRSDLCAIGAGEGHSYYFGRCSHTSFESLHTPRSLRRDASREQANPSYGREEVQEPSLHNRRPTAVSIKIDPDAIMGG
jgi:hypothetical protein